MFYVTPVMLQPSCSKFSNQIIKIVFLIVSQQGFQEILAHSNAWKESAMGCHWAITLHDVVLKCLFDKLTRFDTWKNGTARKQVWHWQ